MIVVDLGCAEHRYLPENAPEIVDASIEPLCERFQADTLYGFDPLVEPPLRRTYGHTQIVLSQRAAWTHEGWIGFLEQGPRSRIYETEAGRVSCFDLATFIASLAGQRIVLKLDIEGAEYQLLRHLHARGVDELLELVLVEWHEDATISLRCPVETWEDMAVVAA